MEEVVIYLESSAVLSWLFEESPEHPAIYQKIDSCDMVIASCLTVMETRRALARMQAIGQLKEKEHARLLGIFEREIKSWEVYPISSSIQERLAQSFPKEPVRTLDAIHLATILETFQSIPGLKVLTLDKRVIENIAAFGLERA